MNDILSRSKIPSRVLEPMNGVAFNLPLRTAVQVLFLTLIASQKSVSGSKMKVELTKHNSRNSM